MGIGLVAATAAFECPGPEPAATGGPGGGGSSSASSMVDGTTTTGLGPTSGVTMPSSSGTGCNADLLNDPMNCGACGRKCSTTNAVIGATGCLEGLCFSSECQPGFFDSVHPPGDVPDDGCESVGKRIFLSGWLGAGGAVGGLNGADMKCQMAGAALNPNGTFKAFLSDSTTNAADRLAHNTGPYFLPDPMMIQNFGMRVAGSWDELVAGGGVFLEHPIDTTEFGYPIPGGRAWTGSNANGLKQGPFCTDWTQFGTAQGTAGDANDVDLDWAALPTPVACSQDDLHLYCIEQ